MKRVAFHTLGCKLNFTETSSISSQFVKNNYIVSDKDNFDIVVINTCSVTQNAERECRQVVRRFIKNNPDAFIIVVGCYSQMRPEEIAKIKGVDLVLGSKEKFKIFEYENDFVKYEQAKIFVTENTDDDSIISSDSTASSRTRAFLKIQDGCDFNCSYCTVPIARGKSRSVSLNEISDKIKEIASLGFKEVVLTGVNVSDYGKNINSSFFELLKTVDKISEIPRIRISSIEPQILNKEIISFIKDSERICQHFHIPLQSGDDDVLKEMQRRYNTNQFKEKIFLIREQLPESCIGFDVIVGFPNETDELFENTYNFLNSLPFNYLHVFSYSPRPNTKASQIKNRIKGNVCDLRSETLRKLSDEKKLKFYENQIGKMYNVLFEERSNDNFTFGLTSNYIKVGLAEHTDITNQILKIKITSANKIFCVGERV